MMMVGGESREVESETPPHMQCRPVQFDIDDQAVFELARFVGIVRVLGL